MISSGLYGPLALSANTIDHAVKGVGPGAFALGRTLHDDEFLIERIGRTDYDLNDHIKDHVGRYLEFKFGFFESSAAAFFKECELFHLFKPRDNHIHPDAPDGSDLTCPHCPTTSMRAGISVGYGAYNVASRDHSIRTDCRSGVLHPPVRRQPPTPAGRTGLFLP